MIEMSKEAKMNNLRVKTLLFVSTLVAVFEVLTLVVIFA